MTSAAKTWSKLAVSGAVLAAVLYGFDGFSAVQILARIRLGGFLVALLLAGVLFALGAFRWHWIARLADVGLPYRRAVVVTFESHFFNQALPATLGGDAYRIWVLTRIPTALSAAVGCVIADRLFGLIALCLLTAVTQYYLLFDIVGTRNGPFVGAPLLVAGALVAALLAVIALRRSAGSGRLASFHRIFESVRIVSRQPLALALVAGVSVAGHLLLVSIYFVLARSLAIELTVGQSLAIFPTILLLATLPITIAGWGVREALLATALGFIGVGSAAAVALGIAFGLLMLVVALPGAFMWVADRDRRAFETRG